MNKSSDYLDFLTKVVKRNLDNKMKPDHLPGKDADKAVLHLLKAQDDPLNYILDAVSATCFRHHMDAERDITMSEQTPQGDTLAEAVMEDPLEAGDRLWYYTVDYYTPVVKTEMRALAGYIQKPIEDMTSLHSILL